MSRFVQAYKQAPWRNQRQMIGLFLVGIVMVAMVAGIYLNVTARAALAGREIQRLENRIEVTQRKISDLETQLAMLMSTSMMSRRASDMGYVPVEPGEIEYIAVPGFTPRKPVALASPPSTRDSAPLIIPAFTQSLLEWLDQQMRSATGAQP